MKRIQARMYLTVGAILLLTGVGVSQTISLSPKSGPPTTKIRVSGTGFSPNTSVDIYFDTTDEALAITDGTGAFSKILITVDASALPGQHWVSAVQRSNDTGAQTPFRVNTNWTEQGFSANGNRVNSYENVLNAENVGTLDVVWTASTGGGSGSPAVVNGVVYVGGGSSMYALNGATGAQLWSYATGGPIVSSAAVAAGVVFFGSSDSNVYAVSAENGTKLWSYSTGGSICSGATVVNGTVYVGSNDNNVYALNAKTGALQWSFTTGNVVCSTPAVVSGVVYVGSWDGTLYWLSASNGSVIFRIPTGGAVGGSPVIVEGVLYFGSSDDNVYAWDIHDNTQLWSYTTGFSVESSPAMYGGVLYIGSDDGNVYALNAQNGSVIWSYATGNTLSSNPSSPAVANGMVYIGSWNNSVYALASVPFWNFATASPVSSSPTVANGMVYVNSDQLYAFGPSNGATRRLLARPDLKTLRPDPSLRPSQPVDTPANPAQKIAEI